MGRVAKEWVRAMALPETWTREGAGALHCGRRPQNRRAG
jgi:hypothetical protein